MVATQQQWIDQFLDYLRHEKAYSSHTISAYRRDLQHFLLYCSRFELLNWSQIKANDVRQFSATRHRQGQSGRSIQRALSAVSRFFQYLARENQVEANPVDSVSAPRGKKRLPAVMDVDQMERLLRIEGDDVLIVRDLALMELFYSSGLRLSELVNLDVGDVDLADRTARVTGKGNKTRIVPVGKQALIAIKTWLKHRSELSNSDEPALFLSQRGTRLRQRSIQQRMRDWGLKQGLAEQVYPHRLRHSFASHVLESSGDIRAVQELLGHANISTTQIYTHLDFQHLAKVYDKSHPRAKKK